MAGSGLLGRRFVFALDRFGISRNAIPAECLIAVKAVRFDCMELSNSAVWKYLWRHGYVSNLGRALPRRMVGSILNCEVPVESEMSGLEVSEDTLRFLEYNHGIDWDTARKRAIVHDYESLIDIDVTLFDGLVRDELLSMSHDGGTAARIGDI